MHDRRLASAYAALAAGQIKVLSLDVFDTLLWRQVPEPSDVFLLLGRKLADGGDLAPHISVVEFAELRKVAEKTARERKEAATGYREVTLAGIHAELPRYLFRPGFDVVAGATAELTLEASLMIGDRALTELMSKAKAQGVQVILVSDTYFTSEQVKAFLAVANAAEGRDYDRLYVSCEAGKPKWRDLFDVIIKDMGVAPNAILHVGDSLEADVWPCRTRGIGFIHYDKWSLGARTQTIEMPEALVARAERLGTRGDYGLTGTRSRLFNRPPENLSAGLVPYWTYGASTLAPVFAAFARWIVSSCRDIGVTRVYGMMREGRFLNRIIREMAATLGVPLETEELWVSRRAVIRAALSTKTPTLLPEFTMLTPGRTTEELLGAMGLTVADLAAEGVHDFDIRADKALATLCRIIGRSDAMLPKVLDGAATQRRNLMTGLGRVLDLKSPGPAVVVDLGYTATIQATLQPILAREGSPLRLTGLYLALNDRATPNVRAGADLRAYLNQEGFAGTMGAMLSRMPFVLEHACMCREGSLAEYDSEGKPVLLPNQREEPQLQQMEAMQDGILAGLSIINNLLGSLNQTPADDPVLKGHVAAIISASHLNPTIQEAVTIGAWKHEAKVDFTGSYKLTDLSFDGPTMEYGGWSKLQDMNLDQVYWPAAAFATADPFIADVYAGGARGAYKPEHLTSGGMLGRVVVCPDAGNGFDERLHGAIPLALNAFGRGDIQAAIKPMNAQAYHRLRFTWPGARAIIALESLIVTYTGDNQRSEREVPGVADFSGWQGARVVEPGLVQAEPQAVWSIDLGAPPPWPHSLEISLRVKYLRLDALYGGRA